MDISRRDADKAGYRIVFMASTIPNVNSFGIAIGRHKKTGEYAVWNCNTRGLYWGAYNLTLDRALEIAAQKVRAGK